MLVPGVLLFSLVLVGAPILLGDEPSPAAAALTQAPFLLAICALAMRKGQWRASTRVLLATGYLVLLIVAAFRAAYFGTITTNAAIFEAVQFSLIATLAAFAFLRETRPSARRRYLLALCWAPVIYIAVNLFLYFAGYAPLGLVAETGQDATVLNVFGLSAQRVVFPMARGPVGMAPTAAIAFAVSVIFAVRGQHRKLALFGATMSLYTILASDSRGALLFAPLAIALVMFTPLARKRVFGWVAVSLPVLPVLLTLALATTAHPAVAARFDRAGAETLSTGTGRSIVWEETFALLSEPRLDHVFGYGQNGQVVSGVSVDYAYLFRNDSDALSHSTHNLVLQAVLDLGWVGGALLIATGAVTLAALARRAGDPLFAALLAGTLAVLFVGTVQAAPTPVHPDSFAWWLMVLFTAVRGYDPKATRAPRKMLDFRGLRDRAGAKVLSTLWSPVVRWPYRRHSHRRERCSYVDRGPERACDARAGNVRVLSLAPGLDPARGGMASAATNMVLASRKAGVDSVVAIPEHGGRDTASRTYIDLLEQSGVVVHAFPVLPWPPGAAYRWGISPAQATWTVRHIAEFTRPRRSVRA